MNPRLGFRLPFTLFFFFTFTPSHSASPYSFWKNGPSLSEDYFPIAVWLQSPQNAPKFKAAGFNLYVGLWEGPTEEQLVDLKQAGMRVICEQNRVALQHLKDPTIAGWMHGDEPDNAQALPQKEGEFGPPILPAQIASDYQKYRKKDPTRPVLLNLGQGVAWDGWYGRGPRTGHPEDYPKYLKGCDIASFDIYPVVHDSPEIKGNLWYVAQGVERLCRWIKPGQTVWNAVECTRIGNAGVKPTPAEVKSEVWMSIIHGSKGIIYFVHQFKPKFIEAALLEDPEMLNAVTALNRQIMNMAPVINSPPVNGLVSVETSNPKVPVDILVKRWKNDIYVFSVCMRKSDVRASFKVTGLSGRFRVEDFSENRDLKETGGSFQDRFGPYEAHLYKITRAGSPR